MDRSGTDSKVKKTLLRNYEQKIKPGTRGPAQVVRDVESYTQVPASALTLKEPLLSEPVLCSSASLANYLSTVKASLPPPLSAEDVANDQGEVSAKVTKKLNFPFNEKIYRNLVELNANFDEGKTKKTKKLTSSVSTIKKDLEPDIEDFCEDEKEIDIPPKICVTKSKFRPIKMVENRDLHKLVASFEVL